MDSKKDQAIVAILTIMLISLYAVIPALGGTGEGGVKVVNKQTGKEVPGAIEKASDKSNSDNDDGGSSGGSSNNDDNSDDSTVDGLNPLNIGKKMVGEGFIYFLELLADAGFSVGMSSDGDTQNIKENYGNAVALVYTMASIEFNPYDNQFIID